jgi:hypothetical protein
MLKKDLRFAENTVDNDNIKLSQLGWSGPAEPTPLAPPGQPRTLKIQHEGEDWLVLSWKRPADGGRPTFYRIERRKQGEGGGRGRWPDIVQVTRYQRPRTRAE